MVNIAPLFARAVQYQQQRRLTEALAAYQQVLALQPDHTGALINGASVLKTLGRTQEALTYYQQAIDVEPDNALAWFNLGNMLQTENQLEASAQAFQTSIQLQPNLAAAHFNLGKLLHNQGQLSAAENCYRQAIALAPTLARAHTNLGNVLKALGQLDSALACHRQALHLQPNYAEGYNNLGTALMAAGQLEAAIAAYEQALKLKPDLMAAQANLAEARQHSNSPPPPTSKNISYSPSHAGSSGSISQGRALNADRLRQRLPAHSPLNGKVLLIHHWPYQNQRQPLFSPQETYITCQEAEQSQVFRLPPGTEFDVEDFLATRLPGWEPDVLIAKVDAFFTLVPRQIDALSCPKVLILGDTHHGVEPLNRMVDYALSEPYDLYLTDHDRHHLWYYWLAGLKDLYWLPSLWLNPPLWRTAPRAFHEATIPKAAFAGKIALIGQTGKHHPRRRRLAAALKTLPQVVQAYLPHQPDTLKAYADAAIALNISLNGDLNLRTFEILSAGGFLLADQLTDESGLDLLLEAGSEYEAFVDQADLLEKAVHFYQHPEQVAEYRTRAYARYQREYSPEFMAVQLDQLLHGHGIDDRFTTGSINRIQAGLDTHFSRDRLGLYQVVQELHRQQEHLSILLDARLKLTAAIDFLDLPRLTLTLTHFEPAYLESLQPYLKRSGNDQRVRAVPVVQSYRSFNVIITAVFDAELLAQLPGEGDVVLLSNDYAGLKTVAAVSALHRMFATRADFDGQFFQVVYNAHQRSRQVVDAAAPACSPRGPATAKANPRAAAQLRKQGMEWHQQGQLEPALTAYQQALAANPEDVAVLTNLGLVHYQQGRLAVAEDYFRRAWELQPEHPTILERLIQTLRDQGRYPAAIALLQERRRQCPTDVAATGLLGAVFCQLGQFQSAIEVLQQGTEQDPNKASLWINLGQALTYQGQLAAAISSCQRAIALNPQAAAAHLNLGFALNNQGRVPAAIACFRESLRIKPDFHFAASHLLYSLNYDPAQSPAAIAQAHRHWGQSFGPSSPLRLPAQPRHSQRPLRIGYVSPDFRRHSVAYFIEPLLAHRSEARFETVCYANSAIADAVTERLRRLADHWHRVFSLSDAQLTALIAKDNIDILVDLAGHTAGNRLGVFARKPAPIQVTYLGYPHTTGLSAIDYRLTDAQVDPPGATDADYTEELVRLPQGFLCYQPPVEAPPVANLPAQQTGQITFGSFNHLPKITPAVVSLWAQILKAIPQSRIVLKARWFGDPQTRDRYGALFADGGIAPSRVQLVGHIPDLNQHLAYYSHIDIALDSFPYNGTTTTCEALWMGVPVITLAGQTPAGRVGLSLLTTVGQPELIAATPEMYVELARRLASDLPQLAQRRRTLREQVAASPLCDAIAQTQLIEDQYQRFWRRHCQAQL